MSLERFSGWPSGCPAGKLRRTGVLCQNSSEQYALAVRRQSGALGRRLKCWLFVLTACWFFCGEAGAAENELPRVSEVQVGFAGYYKVGYWTPVALTIESGSYRGEIELECITPDCDEIPTKVGRKISLQRGTSHKVLEYLKFGKTTGGLQIVLRLDDGRSITRSFSAARNPDKDQIRTANSSLSQLVLVVGSSIGVEQAVRRGRADAGELQVVQLTGAAQLPEKWYGYEGVDWIVVTTSDPSLLHKNTFSRKRFAALRQWVQLGGHLLISLGEQAEQVFAEDSYFSSLVPARLDKMALLRRSVPLEAYCDAREPIETETGRFQVRIPLLTEVDGVIEAFDGTQPTDMPLVIRSASGFGQVVTVAVDLDRPPFADWKGRAQMVQLLLGYASDSEEDAGQAGYNNLGRLGYNDLCGQLRMALEQFSGVTPVAFWIVAVAILGYVLWIGPVDYWIVRRVLKRPELTWITFSIAVVVVCCVAYFTTKYVKGNKLLVNRVELVDVDLTNETIRGTLWGNFYTPRSQEFDLSLKTAPLGVRALNGGEQNNQEEQPQVLLSWLGLPGPALGGMQSTTSSPPIFRQGYWYQRDLSALVGMPIQTWSTKGIAARWQVKEKVSLAATLVESTDRMVEGLIANNLTHDLHDARLFYDQWVYRLGDLPAQEEIILNELLPRLTSRTYLSQRRTAGQQRYSTIYDVKSREISRILDMMMFHEVAGGSKYTLGLTNRYQAFCDLSDHLKLKRAVLVARLKRPLTQLINKGSRLDADQDSSWQFIRFVLPVSEQPPEKENK